MNPQPLKFEKQPRCTPYSSDKNFWEWDLSIFNKLPGDANGPHPGTSPSVA